MKCNINNVYYIAGFQGNDCEENIDDCASDPCQNEGKCVDGVGTYHCICPAGFNGTNCPHNIDECANVDCKNNATCIDQINGFYCACQNGFTGNKCEVNIDECASNPCRNQARFVFMYFKVEFCYWNCFQITFPRQSVLFKSVVIGQYTTSDFNEKYKHISCFQCSKNSEEKYILPQHYIWFKGLQRVLSNF